MTIVRFAGLVVLISACALTGAVAHVDIAPAAAPADSHFRAVFGVGHGCDGAPTTAIRVRLDASITSAHPMPKPGWTLEIIDETVTQPDGNALQVPREIVWSGGSIADNWYDEFVLVARLPQASPGTILYFPVVQECGAEQTRWIETPLSGETPDSLTEPAPFVTIVEPGDHAHPHAD